MSLLNSVLGALGQAQGGQGGGSAALINVVVGMLSQGGAAGSQNAGGGLAGGLAGLVEQFAQHGLGQVAQSWVSSGQNLPISADQISQVLGSGTVANIAQQLGLGHGEAASQLAQVLPHIVDHLTPNGHLPQANASGGLGSLAGMLGGFLKS
jgi:uncharacterized protein YidB (DUF937 family)